MRIPNRSFADDDGIDGYVPFPLRSHSTTCGLGLGSVGSPQGIRVDKELHRLGRLGIDRDKEILSRTGEQPSRNALAWWGRCPDKTILATIKTLPVELLARFDPISLAELGWKKELSF